MLHRLHFTNFKSWESVDLQLGRITALFGTNSSGKTSLLQFLLLLKQTKEATDPSIALALDGDLVKLGTINDAIHKHDIDRDIEFELAISTSSEVVVTDTTKPTTKHFTKSKKLAISAQVKMHRNALRTRRLSYDVGDMKFELAAKENAPDKFDLISEGAPEFRFVRTPGRAWQLPGPIKSYAFPDQTRSYYQNAGFLSNFELAYESAIDDLYYLGPLREYPQRDYLWSRSRRKDVGQRGEYTIDAILAATESNEKRNLKPKHRLMPFQGMIAYWLREMGLISDFEVIEIAKGSNRWQARVKTSKGGTPVLLTDVGFGVSQVLPVITLLYYVPEGSTVILEQPEIHLHPLAQAHLADLILNVAHFRNVQVILESHSEHLLLRLQRRVAESTATPDDVKLYFCDSAKGASELIPLQLDLLGQIDNWPKNFMGDAFGEAIAAEEARLLRMNAAQ